MEKQEKTPWKKHIDKRYISGEDLKFGVEMGRGLRPEMVVTVAKHNTAKTYDAQKREEVDNMALWLAEYPSGKMLYKPIILNNTNGDFLAKEIGGGSIYIDDFDKTVPFVLYAKPDKRFKFVARVKKYFAPVTFDFKPTLAAMDKLKTKDELVEFWTKLGGSVQNIPEVSAKKDELKSKLK